MKIKAEDIRTQAGKKNLLLLYYLRWVAVVGQIVTIAIVSYGFKIELPLREMSGVILFLIALNILSYLRYRSKELISDFELFASLTFDILALSFQFYFSGGATNPFISLYLIQVVIAATILRGFYTWLLVTLSLTCYVYLSFNNIEIPHLHHFHIGEFFNLHIHGMLISYAISAVLVAYFVVKMSKNLKMRDMAIANIREQKLSEENILRLGMLAANAAHELGTPLSTIAILAGEYKQDANDANLQKRADILNNEIMRCKNIISQITNVAGAARVEEVKTENMETYFKNLAEKWKQSRSSVAFTADINIATEQTIIVDYAFEQAITNLLNNAADASPDYVHLQVFLEKNKVKVIIEDKGTGIDKKTIDSLGNLVESSKPGGMGMGLMLSKTVITRLNGELDIETSERGTKIIILTPLKAISA